MTKKRILRDFNGVCHNQDIEPTKLEEILCKNQIIEAAAVTSKSIAKIIDHECTRLEQFANQLISPTEMIEIDNSIIKTLDTIINLENTILSKLKLIYSKNDNTINDVNKNTYD